MQEMLAQLHPNCRQFKVGKMVLPNLMAYFGKLNTIGRWLVEFSLLLI